MNVLFHIIRRFCQSIYLAGIGTVSLIALLLSRDPSVSSTVRAWRLFILVAALAAAGLFIIRWPVSQAHMLIEAEATAVRMSIPPIDRNVIIEFGVDVNHLTVMGDLTVINNPYVSEDQRFDTIDFTRHEGEDTAVQPQLLSIELPSNAQLVIDASKHPTIELSATLRGTARVRATAAGRRAYGSEAARHHDTRELSLLPSPTTIEHRHPETRILGIVFDVPVDSPERDMGFELRGLIGVPANELRFVHAASEGANVPTLYRSSLIQGICTFRGRELGSILLRHGEEVRGDFEGMMLRTHINGEKISVIWEGDVTGMRAGFGERNRSVMPSLFEYHLGTSPRAYLTLVLSYLMLIPIFRILRTMPSGPDPRYPVGGVD